MSHIYIYTVYTYTHFQAAGVSLQLHCSVSTSVTGACCLWSMCPMSFTWKDSKCQGWIWAHPSLPLSQRMSRTKSTLLMSYESPLCRDSPTVFFLRLRSVEDYLVPSLDELASVQQGKKHLIGIKVLAVCLTRVQCTWIIINTQRRGGSVSRQKCCTGETLCGNKQNTVCRFPH